MAACPACGFEYEGNLKFCPECAAPLTAPARAVAEERKVVCSSWKSEDDTGCGFRIWKVVAKRRLTPDEARQLIETGHSKVLEGFVSRKGAAFAAALELKDDLTTSFAFAPRSSTAAPTGGHTGEESRASALAVAALASSPP